MNATVRALLTDAVADEVEAIARDVDAALHHVPEDLVLLLCVGVWCVREIRRIRERLR